MLFNSFPFLIFFPVVTLVYYVLPYRWRWAWLLAASCFFYMWFKPIYILILLTTIIIDYSCALMIERYRGTPRKSKAWLVASIVSTLTVLFIFKYQGLFHETHIILPIGLSFHTFQSLSYVIEVYRGNQRPERHFGIYSLYVMFYPQLVTGPIERPQNLLRQLRIDQPFERDNLSRGIMLILYGLFAKMVVADNLAVYVDAIWADPQQYGSGAIALGLVFYSFQIYCDFFGYSTIALGCAKAMGYDLMDNFRAPYLSSSIGEYWRRWHISLSSWFRDYLYIPLGGSRVGVSRWMFNIMVVFLLSGLWHGANWTFVAWGGLHGLLLLAEGLPKKLCARKAQKTNHDPQCAMLSNQTSRTSPNSRFSILYIIKLPIVFLVVTALFAIFRAPSFEDLMTLFGSLVGNVGVGEMPTVDIRAVVFLLCFVVVDILLRNSRFDRWCIRQRPVVRWMVCFLLAFCTVAFASVETFPFIYFQF
ncbi:MAG: MBOAT family protein [Bacteroidales bacterium]|nr:MBOAT family protein [Bacteroidales bacterium]